MKTTAKYAIVSAMSFLAGAGSITFIGVKLYKDLIEETQRKPYKRYSNVVDYTSSRNPQK